ncbi:LLM class flavin-dependent oxidoreductase, partial [Paenibacillus sepulcri]|nr:LLM class flavin-dependent oxidoreductase [Paenibacillus sepulcri]
TFHEPYNVARSFATLDHFSNGRAGWNIVTTSENARATANYSSGDPIHHAEGYERALEFIDVATKLWDSWEDEALVFNKETGIYTDTDKIRPINHIGPYFSVQGPLNAARSPQAYPVLVQAGSSETGRDFAARTAEVIYTAQQSLAEAEQFARDIKSRMAKFGRGP